MNTQTVNNIQFTRINNDTNGNPRYVAHFLSFLSVVEQEQTPLKEKYLLALKKAKKIGGRKFHNKQYGGGIVFQSYSLPVLAAQIEELAK